MITKLTIPGPDFIPSVPVAGAVKDPVNVLGGWDVGMYLPRTNFLV